MRRIWKWLAGFVVLMVGLGVVGWFFFLKSDAAPRAAIEVTPTVAPPASGVHGSWSVTPGDTDSFVGYRVTEKLPGAVIEQETTGRTNNITATMVIRGNTVTDVTATADLRDLTSDNSLRDSHIKDDGLESNKFPFGTFELTEPIELEPLPDVGETITARATGAFTLHGVTRRVAIPVEGRWDGDRIQVVGSLPIVFADYDMTPPEVPVVASIDDKGEMEFQLFFQKV
ncbi:MAG: YceI family protein [Acidimicrobiia bacterium]